jgi:hypothetical protein
MKKQLYWLNDAPWERIEPLMPCGRRGFATTLSRLGPARQLCRHYGFRVRIEVWDEDETWQVVSRIWKKTECYLGRRWSPTSPCLRRELVPQAAVSVPNQDPSVPRSHSREVVARAVVSVGRGEFPCVGRVHEEHHNGSQANNQVTFAATQALAPSIGRESAGRAG